VLYRATRDSRGSRLSCAATAGFGELKAEQNVGMLEC
jgi:hypothetical protein